MNTEITQKAAIQTQQTQKKKRNYYPPRKKADKPLQDQKTAVKSQQTSTRKASNSNKVAGKQNTQEKPKQHIKVDLTENKPTHKNGGNQSSESLAQIALSNTGVDFAESAIKSGEKTVKITFLGGVGEIGKNMTAFEYDNEIIVVDAGLAFPGIELPGVDLVVPDITYLTANKNKVKAIILTHGHEDHIGGLPFVLSDIPTVIYGSAMTLAIVDNKLKEFPKIKYKAVTVKPRSLLKIGNFQIEFIKVSHSIPGALALCITTPVGRIVHSGDFKIDFKPIDGVTTDLIRFGELGKMGVKLLMCESTNVCRKGYSMSESNVGKTLADIFMKVKNTRIFVATFASNVHRMQQILDLAEKYGKKVAFSGRSMLNISEAGLKIGELKYNKDNIIDIDKIDKYADNELVILCTGSQGESQSALARMAAGEFKKVDIGDNDTIIFSASPIPGNEKSVYNVINQLFKKGANVIYDELAEVHASGHACEEEIKTIHTLINPEFFIPVHGEYRHLKQHKDLSVYLGTPEMNIITPDLGMQIELGKNFMRRVGYVQAGQRLVDGLGLGDMQSSVLKERKQLSEDGFCIAVIKQEYLNDGGDLDPIIITRGVVYDEENDEFVADAKTIINQAFKEIELKSMELNDQRAAIRKVLSNFIYRRTKRRPMIIAMVV